MTKPGYSNGVKFFETLVKSSSNIINYRVIKDNDWLIYKINRPNPFHSFNVLIVDEYLYTLENYYQKPEIIKRGDFIYLMGTWQSSSSEADIHSRQDGIYIGNPSFFKMFINTTLENIN